MQRSEVQGLVVHHIEVWVVWTSVRTKVVVALLLDVEGDSSPNWSVVFHREVVGAPMFGMPPLLLRLVVLQGLP